ncbi:unnamed protein product [Acanthoscelides obtectus]|uniref:Uncharacterized protein n=1 Tax=Acanthoscelides obtectus TaxID=200917 RepID=A0A9P0L4G3_ACAOB|nr:unnamed protein product [Acanthoscelides obtectus]CAK1636429.1 hypothetical protein AOBTE_LOCUS9846 [Acanthoscelides obtectus]
MDEEHIVGDQDRGSRKRKWGATSRQRQKEIRYDDPDPNLDGFEVPCKHGRNKKLSCKDIPFEDLRRCRQKFYSQKDKVKQDTKLSHLIEIGTPRRKKRSDFTRNPNITVHYNVWSSNSKKRICQKMFLKIFGISQKRIQNISRQMKAGSGISENRGGDRRSQKKVEKRKKVKAFIANLKGQESHYGRAKSKRIYLSAEYNITILHRLYNDSVEESYKLSTERWREDEELQWLRPIFPEPLEELQENSDEDNAQEVCNCIEDDGGVKV